MQRGLFCMPGMQPVRKDDQDMALSPMMQQYQRIKEKYSDCLLFFRVGDFYEMFFDDAHTASRELELTLTGKDCGLAERAPMCGVPFHAVDNYVEKLVSKGYRVAICEQMEDPALAKGLVERDVIRVYTAGTLNDPSMLDEKKPSYILSVSFFGKGCGLAFADVSTGEFQVYSIDRIQERLRDEMARLEPGEIITQDMDKLSAFLHEDSPAVSRQPASWFSQQNASEVLCSHFSVADTSALGLGDDMKAEISAAGALLKYLAETQKNALEHITGIKLYQGSEYMLLDTHTRRNLELTESIRGRNRKGTLLQLLDRTSTAMGARMLRTWIEQPLLNRMRINKRLDSVEEFVSQHILTERIAEELSKIYDVERLLSKVSYSSLNAHDCLSLCASFSRIPGIIALLSSCRSQGVREIAAGLDPLTDITDLLQRAIHPDAPVVITEGGIIRDGYSKELDEYREAATNGKQWILDLEAREKERTGIRTLKVQYNRVFGYYIEVTKSFLSQVPENYIRKQTLTNAERFMTPELKEMEQKIMGAQEQSVRLELRLFTEIRGQIAAQIARIQKTAEALKTLDAIISLARVATEFQYVRPNMTEDGALEIQGGRHPVVEQMMTGSGFVPNDTVLNCDDARMLIITGPNMAGKSTYMRQVALITLMAHIGSFVPAEHATIPIVDRIFTRVGASDDLASGQSTFMVEMAETAAILRNATSQSLIILDEIGRGTSTFDGLAIAWAVVEYICDKKNCGAKTLFATHYHELSELEGHLDGVQNYCISVKEHGEDVIFLRKIVRGGADKSFGIHVASLAGIPHPVLVRAHEIQARLEVSDINQNTISQSILGEEKRQNEQVNLFEYQKTEIINELQAIDIMALTPIDAMNKLFLLREKARKL